MIVGNRASALEMIGRYEEARETYNKSIALASGEAVPQHAFVLR